MTTQKPTTLAEAEALAGKNNKAAAASKKPAADKPKAPKAPADKPKASADKPKGKTKTEAEIKAEEALKAAEKAAAKAKKDAEANRFKTVTIEALAGDAKEINIRFEKADKLVGQADDHRLAASIKLADAKEKCREAKINFQDWCKENLKQSYETVRKLLPVGIAENEKEGSGKLLLEDMRNRNAEVNRKHRAEAKAASLQIEIETALKEAAPDAVGRDVLSKASGMLKMTMDDDKATLEVLVDRTAAAKDAFSEFKRGNGLGKRAKKELTPEQQKAHEGANASDAPARKLTDLERVEAAVAGCPKDVRANTVKAVAESNGFICMTVDEAAKVKALRKASEQPPKAQIELLFSRLTTKEKSEVAAWVAIQVGGVFSPKS